MMASTSMVKPPRIMMEMNTTMVEPFNSFHVGQLHLSMTSTQTSSQYFFNRTSCPVYQRYPKRAATATTNINNTVLFTIVQNVGGGGGIRTPEGCYTLTV